jgi:hypothetical protein
MVEGVGLGPVGEGGVLELRERQLKLRIRHLPVPVQVELPNNRL